MNHPVTRPARPAYTADSNLVLDQKVFTTQYRGPSFGSIAMSFR